MSSSSRPRVSVTAARTKKNETSAAIANALISVSFPSLVLSPGLAFTYLGYAIAALVSFFFVRAAVTETRGRELEDMTG